MPRFQHPFPRVALLHEFALFYTLNGRLVLDFLGKLWKVKWLGLGASCFLGDHFSGWSAGLDLRFKF
jgi:hypothetical protein